MNKTRYRRQASNGSEQVSFLPEPDFNPKLPFKNTLAYRALYLMMQGRMISHIDFQGETDSYRLAAYIHDLVKLGWPILNEDVLFYAKNKPHNRQYRRYFLSRKVLRKFKSIFGGVYE